MSKIAVSKGLVSGLSRVNAVFLIALALRVIYPIVSAVAGVELPAYLLVRIFFLVTLVLFLIVSFPKLARAFLWRVRHRLLVTWVFVGVVPIVLICALLAEGMFILLGQTVGYMTTTEIVRHGETVRSAASTLAWSLEHRDSTMSEKTLVERFLKETTVAQHGVVGAIVRKGQDSVAIPEDGAIREIPMWVTSNFAGLVRDPEHRSHYYFGAEASAGDPGHPTEVFLYEEPTQDFFKDLLPGVASVLLVSGNATVNGVDIRSEVPRSGIRYNSPGSDPDPRIELPAPPGRGWWDREIDWVLLIPTRNLKTGDNKSQALGTVSSRPSLILKRLFSTLGNFAFFTFFVMIATAALLFVVELVSALVGFKLTRSITRAVADLYEATRRVQAGDFSHRIPVRKTKDQLSELGGSFNTMTERIESLIIEVKEKERLENELSIAREVQSQLFPKDFPHLKTLELWGGCQPARTVSGDYYDFVALGSDRAALAIGDISGKGISAALLMAHIQSALRSQLVDRISQSGDAAPGALITSPSVILSILNDHLYKSSPPEKYSTFFLGLYSDVTSQLIYTNAGHLAPMIVRKGRVLRLPGDGFPVGLFPGIRYDQQTFGLEPGDVLVAFTDGVTETANREGEEFADGRLTEILLRHSSDPLDHLAKEISSTVDRWADGLERHDDTTLLLARRLELSN